MTSPTHHQAWQQPHMITKFDDKRAGDFFDSERMFLDRLDRDLSTALDVGCASGRFIELLNEMCFSAAFTGIDLTEASVTRARANYPDARFIAGDALALDLEETFDLVNATGVMQHEPRYHALIRQMLKWSSKAVMFDVKLAGLDRSLEDVSQAYGRIGDDILYFIVLAWPEFQDFLRTLEDVDHIIVHGYETKKNNNTVLPDYVDRLVSAGVLLLRGDSGEGPTFSVDLPSFVLNRVKS